MSRYEQENKFQRDLNKTQNTFGEDRTINRAEQVRRDDDVIRGPVVTLEQIDYAIKYFIENRIQAYVDQDNEIIKVPVMYASPEKWASVQRQGYIRDSKGKIMTPLIMYNRTGMSQRQGLEKNKFIDDSSNRHLYVSKYSKNNRYDNFSQLTNQVPKKEYYSIAVPDYVDVTYQLIVWCDYTRQVNKLVEQLQFWEGQAWGDTYKFVTDITNVSFTTQNETGQDRFVQATIDIKVAAYLVPKDIGTQTNLQKMFGPKKVVFGTQVGEELSKPRVTDDFIPPPHQSFDDDFSNAFL